MFAANALHDRTLYSKNDSLWHIRSLLKRGLCLKNKFKKTLKFPSLYFANVFVQINGEKA